MVVIHRKNARGAGGLRASQATPRIPARGLPASGDPGGWVSRHSPVEHAERGFVRNRGLGPSLLDRTMRRWAVARALPENSPPLGSARMLARGSCGVL